MENSKKEHNHNELFMACRARFPRLRFSLAMKTVMLFLALLLAACQSPGAIYLGGGRHFDHVPDSTGVAQLALMPFEESFAKNEEIGEFITNTQQRQVLIMQRGLFARSLDAALKKKMTQHDLAFISYGDWDLTLKGLSKSSRFPEVIVGGRIKEFHLHGEQKVMPANYNVSMSIECLMGMPGKNKMVTRTVQISQGMVKIDGRYETMQSIVDELLDNAADRTVSKIKEMMQEEGLF